MNPANQNEVRLKRVLADVFDVSESSVNDDSSPDTISSWSSLNHLKLVLALEGEFGISFSEEQTVEIMNFPLIKAVLAEHGVQFSK